jgi:hypothetical protein
MGNDVLAATVDVPHNFLTKYGQRCGFVGREGDMAGRQQADAFEVIRGGEARAQMIALNRDNPAAVDDRFLGLKPALEDAVKDHSAL